MSNWRAILEFEVDDDKLAEHNATHAELALPESVTKWRAAELAVAVEFEIVDFASPKSALLGTERTG